MYIYTKACILFIYIYIVAEKEIKGKIKKIQKKELNISTEKKSPWKIQIFCDYFDEKKGYLLICDIIWINFSEDEVEKNIFFRNSNNSTL